LIVKKDISAKKYISHFGKIKKRFFSSIYVTLHVITEVSLHNKTYVNKEENTNEKN